VEQPGRLVQQDSPKREQAELLRPICTAPRRGLEEPVRSQSAIGEKKMVFHTTKALKGELCAKISFHSHRNA